MVDGWPDGHGSKRSLAFLGSYIGRQGRTAAGGRIRKMVALLWAEGQGDAAIRLEQLWNDLASLIYLRAPINRRFIRKMIPFRKSCDTRM
jgi:hypothetical protein